MNFGAIDNANAVEVVFIDLLLLLSGTFSDDFLSLLAIDNVLLACIVYYSSLFKLFDIILYDLKYYSYSPRIKFPKIYCRSESMNFRRYALDNLELCLLQVASLSFNFL